MKCLTSYMVMNSNGTDRISFTYDEINDKGDLVSRNNKRSFYVMDPELKKSVNAIKDYINNEKMG